MPRRRRSRQPESGSASLQLVVVFPALLLLIMAGVQAALWFHCRHIALAAARVGVHAGRIYHAQPGAAETAARTFAARQGAGLLQGVRVTVTRAGGTVVVTVAGHAPSLVPGVSPGVTQQAHGPRERIVGAEQAGQS